MTDDAGITKDSKIIIYDVNDSDAEYVYNWLKGQGYSAENMKTFNGTDLINSGKAKVVKYKNYDMYVPEDVVKNISDNLTGKSDKYDRNAKHIVNGDDVVILDVSWGDETSDPNTGSGYDAGHIPGAVHVNTDEYETPRVYVKTKPEKYRTEWKLNSDKELIQLAEKKGITLDSCVIIAGPEPMATTRMAVILKYLGVENVHVMSNAMTGWNAAGYSMEKGINTNKTTNLGITKPQNPDVIDTISEVRSELKNSKYAVIDTRSKAEWDGKDTGYGYHDLAGRIPGTIYSNCGYGYSSSVFRYRNADKSMKRTALTTRLSRWYSSADPAGEQPRPLGKHGSWATMHPCTATAGLAGPTVDTATTATARSLQWTRRPARKSTSPQLKRRKFPR